MFGTQRNGLTILLHCMRSGTGVNQEDKFGGTYRKGDACWLCEGKAKTMCGNCADLTDTF